MKISFVLYKLTDQLLKNTFPISVLTYRRQVIYHSTKQNKGIRLIIGFDSHFGHLLFLSRLDIDIKGGWFRGWEVTHHDKFRISATVGQNAFK